MKVWWKTGYFKVLKYISLRELFMTKEKSDRHQHNQVNKAKMTNNKRCQLHKLIVIMHWKGTAALLWYSGQKCKFNYEKHQANLNWGILYKITDQYNSKCQGHKKWRKT